MKKLLILTVTLSLTLQADYLDLIQKGISLYSKHSNHSKGYSSSHYNYNSNIRVKRSDRILHYPINLRAIYNIQNCSQVVKKRAYISCYDYDSKLSRVLSYSLSGDELRSGYIKRVKDKFYDDRVIPYRYRAFLSDYSHSGYDRGHIRSYASSAFDYDYIRDTYSLINIAPQTKILNRKLWLKVEKYERLLARRLGHIDVTNITYFDKNIAKSIGKHRVGVPGGFYKILSNRNANFLKCFYYSNSTSIKSKNDKLKNHIVECSEVRY